MNNLVAIVGRPNVGKSTFFNRITGGRKAIVHDTSGVTRDRKYDTAEWNGKSFTLIDTGGFVPGSTDIFEASIRDQVNIAMEEADLVLFMVDVTTGITDLDEMMADMLRKSDKEVMVVVNKVDNHTRLLDSNEFYAMGFEHLFPLSSINGSGTGELLDAVAEKIPLSEPEESKEIPRITIVGRPNVGKSSLLNALAGEERNIVTDIAGTTRDAIHTRYNLFNKDLLLIDTAGVRKKGKVHENIEFYSVMRAIRAMEEADICLIMIDATTGMEAQDVNIFSLAVKRKKGMVILVNKWDLVEKETNTVKDYTQQVLASTAPFKDVPVVFISALHKQRIFKALEVALKVYESRQQKITTSKLNQAVQEMVSKQPPPSTRGRHIQIKYATQIKTAPPVFAFYCNYPDEIKPPYKRYIENQLRDKFDFKGVTMSIVFKKK